MQNSDGRDPHPALEHDRLTAVRLLERDQDALAEMFDRHRAALMSTALRVTRERTAAEDVVQDVFVGLWRRPASYDPTRGSLTRWLHMRCRCAAIDRLRLQSRRDHRERAVEAGVPDVHEDAYFADDPLDGLSEALGRLTVSEQTLIGLAFFEGLTYRAAARVVGLPEGTAKSQIRRSLHSLRADLGQPHNPLTTSR